MTTSRHRLPPTHNPRLAPNVPRSSYPAGPHSPSRSRPGATAMVMGGAAIIVIGFVIGFTIGRTSAPGDPVQAPLRGAAGRSRPRR